MRLVDASVAIKWVLPEEYAEQAVKLRGDSLAVGDQMVYPPHMTSEVMNAIYRRTWRGDPGVRLTLEEADDAAAAFLSLSIRQIRSPRLYQRAWMLAHSYRIPTIYDSLYVALAELLDTPVWTADRRLQRTMGPDYPLVRWIGDYGA
ncbi:MAG TPA: type II toxin-antitoxin system VapC family toxin [Thermomicrobiaceae bacterium]|nr:type II toxin-antitoxin system VapC family toxin [Thermomicrobiaceae bacterium]